MQPLSPPGRVVLSQAARCPVHQIPGGEASHDPGFLGLDGQAQVGMGKQVAEDQRWLMPGAQPEPKAGARQGDIVDDDQGAIRREGRFQLG